MTIEPICAVCGERHQSGDASLAVIDARIEARAYQGGLDAVHDLHTLRVALAERTRERDEWQKAGQQFVDMFDPCKPRADWPVLVAVATGVKHANGSLRAERDSLVAEVAALRSANGLLTAEAATTRAAYEADARVDCPSCPHVGGHVCAGVRAPLPDEASEAVRQMVEDAAQWRHLHAGGRNVAVYEGALGDVDDASEFARYDWQHSKHRREYTSFVPIVLLAELDASRRVVEAAKRAYPGAKDYRSETDALEAVTDLAQALIDHDARAARGWRGP